MSEPHKIQRNDTRTWLDLYRENAGLKKEISQLKFNAERDAIQKDLDNQKIASQQIEIAALQGERDALKREIHEWSVREFSVRDLIAARKAAEAERDALRALVLNLQAHAREHGWQDVDEPLEAILRWVPPQQAANLREGRVTAVTARCSTCGSYCDDIQWEYDDERTD